MLAVGLALAAPPASAAPYMVSIMQDDNQLIHGTAAQRERALTAMRELGVDAVRVSVLWFMLGPEERTPKGDRPSAYRARDWDRWDELAKSAREKGIAVNFNITGPGPRWAHRRGGPANLREYWKPDPKAFRRFVHAVATRYSGGYRDENDGHKVLPRVTWWSIWNEPNFFTWLAPQSQRSRLTRGQVPYAPAAYRELLAGAAKALLATGHGGSHLTIGELQPLGAREGGPRRALRPARFIRELFCLDGRLRPYRGAAARARRCDRVGKLAVLNAFDRLSFGHHPYARKASPRSAYRNVKDVITIANIDRLPRLLDRIADRTGLIPEGMPILSTEFGYQTRPPDPFGGVPLARQAQYLNEADFIAYGHPRIFSTAQFQLDDVPPRTQYPRGSKQYWHTFQSGLIDLEGSPKPSARAYMLPFVLRRLPGGSRHTAWGQLRFLPRGAASQVQLQAKRGGEWSDLGPPLQVQSFAGFFETTVELERGTPVRALWISPDGSEWVFSRETQAK